jgi:EAL domain-containing protein (putative c-di-GMP-specific phosphodiesterase class I)
MPIDIQTAEMQQPINWIFRMVIFCLIGMVVGGLFQRDHKQLEKIKWMVYHELDTGVPNRTGLIRQLDRIIQRSDDPDHIVLFLVMLNNFREITSVLDVEEINMLNAEIFNRLYPIINEDEKAFQLFPYIFGLIFENVQETDTYEKIAAQISEGTKQPIRIHDIPIFVDVSIGAAIYSSEELDSKMLLRRAQMAAQIAFEKGIRLWIYSQKTDAEAREAKVLAGGIVEAIKKGQVSLYYQPIINVKTQTFEGVEALLRWDHPEFGKIPPLHFLPALERTAFIFDVHEWVYREALQAMKRWDLYQGFMSINLSTRLLVDQSWIEGFSQFISENQIDPARILFEVTETALMEHPDASLPSLNALKGIGVSLALDDFGTGYSSLSYLQNLPIDIIKIDIELCHNIHLDLKKQMIANSIIFLSRSMGIRTIAEGVEDLEEFKWLQGAGCDSAQGYFFAKPLPEKDLIAGLSR